MTDVSIIIVNYNTLSLTRQCIDSVIEHTSGISYEIILVDNASTDGSREAFSADSRVKYIFNEGNIGFGRANNIGIGQASGRNVFLLNSDTVLVNNAVKVLSDYLDANPGTGVCGGNLFTSDMKENFSFSRTAPSVFTEWDRLLKYIPGKLRYGKNVCFNHTGRPLDVWHVTGADFMIPRHVIEEVGAFNPGFFMYFEETELCFRVHKAGYAVRSVPQAEIIHLDGRSFKTPEDNSRRGEMFEKSKWLYFSLTSTPSYVRRVKAVLRLTGLTRKISSVFKGK